MIGEEEQGRDRDQVEKKELENRSRYDESWTRENRNERRHGGAQDNEICIVASCGPDWQ